MSDSPSVSGLPSDNPRKKGTGTSRPSLAADRGDGSLGASPLFPQPAKSPSRRDFLRTGAVVAAAPALATTFAGGAHAAGSDKLRVGLVGCGGRGTGAAGQALHADPGVELVALGDAFPEQIQGALSQLRGDSEVAARVNVPSAQQFVGLDAYRGVIEACDVVLLASPPAFRPVHFRAAVDAGKHVFAEKPTATDAPGIRKIQEAVAIAEQTKLAVVAGFCWRYDAEKRALFEQIHSGAIGEVRAALGTYLTSPVKPMPPASTRPAGMGDLEWMVRNWYNFTWLSGDGLVEQAVHTCDWLAWIYKDQPPVSCTAVGGRAVPAEGGNIFDHIEVNFVWENDARGTVAQRQSNGCHNENSLYVLGTKGTAKIGPRGVSVAGEKSWRFRGQANNMYQQEHDELFRSIRAGTPLNDGMRLAQSTLLAIMGRMAAYTGQEVTWQMAQSSQEKLVAEFPEGWQTKVAMPKLAVPGMTRFV